MTLTPIRCPYCNGKSIEAQRTYTIQCGEPRTLYYCAPCARSFSETRHTPLAQLKTPLALVVQVLAALTEGVGINAATRLYGVLIRTQKSQKGKDREDTKPYWIVIKWTINCTGQSSAERAKHKSERGAPQHGRRVRHIWPD